MKLNTAWLIMLGLLITAIGCARPQQTEPTVGVEPPEERAEEVEAEAELTDGEIAQVLWTVDRSEVQKGQLALARAQDPEVRQFAAHVVQGHAEAATQNQQLLAAAGIEPRESDVSQELESEARDAYERLSAAEDDDFDRVYLESQVHTHQRALDTIDEALLPNAESPELREQLNALRPVLTEHLSTANRLLGEVQQQAPAS